MQFTQNLVLVTEEQLEKDAERFFPFKGGTYFERVLDTHLVKSLKYAKEYVTVTKLEKQPPVNGTSQENTFCKIISSAPAENKKYNTVAMPQFAFMSPDGKAPAPSTQFLSNPDMKKGEQFFIGLFLQDEIPMLTLKAVEVTVRVPMEPQPVDLEGVNHAPVPGAIQIFGTTAEWPEDGDLNKLDWEPITKKSILAPNIWAYMTPTTLPIENSFKKYRGFKFVVYDWNTDKAIADDKTPGLSRIAFKFDEDELNAIEEETVYVVKDTRKEDEDGVVTCMAVDMKAACVNVTPGDDGPDDTDKPMKMHWDDDFVAEGVDKIYAAVQDRLVMSTHYLEESLQSAAKDAEDKILKKSNELSDQIEAKMIVLDGNIKSLIEKTDGLDNRYTKIEAFIDGVNKHLNEVDANAHHTEEEIEGVKQKLEDRCAVLFSDDNLTKLLSKLPAVTALAKLAQIVEDSQDRIEKLSKKITEILDTTSMVVVDEQTDDSVALAPGVTANNTFNVVNSKDNKDKSITLTLSKDFTEGDTVTIANMRKDGGLIKIVPEKAKLNVNYQGKAYDGLTNVTLDTRGEQITVMLFKNDWIGKISS